MTACGVLTLAALATVAGVVAETKGDSQVRQAVQQSVQFEKSKDYKKAIAALLERAPAHRPDDVLSQRENYILNLRLGWLYYLNGDHADADRCYQAAIQAAPGSREAKLGRLLPLLAAEKAKEAETLAREVLSEDRKSYYGNLRLAVALRLQGKAGEARQIVQRMLVAYPADIYYAGEMARLNSIQGAAGAAPAPSPADEPGYSAALKTSIQHEVKQKYAEAIETLSEPYAAHPQDYTLNLRLGWLYYLTADYRSSARYYHAALQVSPRSTEAGLGYLLPLLAQARYKDAESMAAQIVEGDPGNYYGNVRLAFALRMQGRYAEAEQIVQRMLAAYPGSILFLLEQGMLHAAQNRKDAAREVFSDVLMLDPDDATAKQQLGGL